MNNHVYLSGLPTTISLFYNVIMVLVMITILNRGLKYVLPGHQLKRGELLTVYVMLSIASAMTGHDMLQTVVPVLTHGFWYATPENEWQQLFWSYLPSWLVVSNTQELQVYYQGDSTLYTHHRMGMWLMPTLWWILFFTVLVWVMICLSLWVRKQWIYQERLSYPVIHLPAEMTTPGGPLFHSKLLWLGSAISASIALINGIHYLVPAIPEIPNRQHEIGLLFTQKPWNTIGWTPIYFLPFAVGLAFFMPLDLSFSVWFFYWLWKGIRITGSAIGFQSLPRFPYAGEQTTGAYLTIIAFAIWNLRRNIVPGFRPMSKIGTSAARKLDYYLPWELWGGIAGIAILVFWMRRGGMSIGISLIYLGFYFLIALSITRLRAEVGPPTHEMYETTPHNLLVTLLGTRRIGTSNLTMMGLLWGFNRGYRAHPMPHTLEAFKLADIGQMDRKRLIGAMVIATAVGSLSAYWAFIEMSYRDGGLNYPGWGGFDHLQNWLYAATPTDWVAVSFISLGAIITTVLRFLRFRFIWWTLHPIGFALTGSTWTIGWLWFSIFLSWLAKRILLNRGGISAYRRAAPFFMGLLLGDYLVGGSWIIVRLIFRIETYVFWR